MGRVNTFLSTGVEELAASTQYRQSSAQVVILVSKVIATYATIQAFGSGDGYTSPYTEFGDDETIMVAGTISADDKANLMGVGVEIYANGALVGTAVLYGYDGTYNYYMYTLGVLAAGGYTIEARFPRTRR